ncbi:MAG: nucleotidyltransferase domain-containing protein [Proteobacteria bacterium]|nr:nucleotidyltransferase domain-containing protein [Pseudomonadota bacterium]
MQEYKSRKKYSDKTIEELRTRLSEAKLPENFAVVINGSFARREGSAQSDLDSFILFEDESSKEASSGTFERVNQIILDVVPNAPAPGGPFDQETSVEEIVRNIGGMEDHNAAITRRALLLFEGDFLYGEKIFLRCQDKLIARYINNKITDHQLALFLLNDRIRYYRTICVDFEFKTTEDNKPYGIRNIKLVFSRKMLFFGGVIVVAETAQKKYIDKIETLKELIAIPPIERISKVCGGRAAKALGLYDDFLKEISQEAVRRELEGIRDAEQGRDSDLFRRMKNDGHAFTWELLSLLQTTYHPNHPIHKSLIM